MRIVGWPQQDSPVRRGLKSPVSAWQLLSVYASWSGPLELSGSLSQSSVSPVTIVGSVTVDDVAPLDVASDLTTTTAVPTERLADLTVSTQTPAEWSTGGVVLHTIPTEQLVSTIQTRVISLEVSGSHAGLVTTPSERTSELQRSSAQVVSYAGGLAVVIQQSAEYLSGIVSEILSPVEFLRIAVSIDRSDSLDLEILSGLRADVALPDEQSTRTQSTNNLPIQLSFRTTLWMTPGPGCWTVFARDVTMTLLSPDVTMSVESV